ncbi:hypothetical protein TorRG33x02_018980 [Trema orientale]|uniref:Uncharacterized protein n=1 Tax=Trema orientale TaxID=63057 RepID=A0A2P5FWF6_TREOI|nr:hypothetical protein TorRG33x02_018980 [Trema orientale]
MAATFILWLQAQRRCGHFGLSKMCGFRRNNLGQLWLCHGHCGKNHWPLNTKIAEASALVFRMQWASEIFPSLEAVESDAQAVITALKNAHTY